MSVGRTLKHLRELAGLTLEEVATYSRIDLPRLISAETGSDDLSLHEIEVYSSVCAEKIGAGSLQARPVVEASPERVWETRECLVTGCIDGQHQFVDGVMDDECCCIRIGSSPPVNELWHISGYRDGESGRWEAFANVDLDEISGVAGLVEVERFVTAYRAVHEHCESLNGLGQHVARRSVEERVLEAMVNGELILSSDVAALSTSKNKDKKEVPS